MKSSDKNRTPENILDEILVLLDEEHLQKSIDMHFDTAVMSFKGYAKLHEPMTEKTFINAMANFIIHVYATAMPVARTLEMSQARAEAIWLIEHTYQGSSGRGYGAALRDVLRQGETGIEHVLGYLADALKSIERQNYFGWVLASRVDPLDWDGKRRLVEILLRRLDPFQTDDVKACSAAQLANYYPKLIRDYLDTSYELSRMIPNSPSTRGLQK